MLTASSIVRHWIALLIVARLTVALLFVAIESVLSVPWAAAQTIDVSLNVFYDQPTIPEQSGGTWQIAAKTSGSQGIAGLDLRLTGVAAPPPAVPVGPRGTVNGNDPAGFSELDSFSIGDVVNLIIGQAPIGSPAPGEEESVFYGVGTLVNGEPGDIGPAFTSLTNTVAIPWASSNPFGDPAWSTAALLAEGAFLAGAQPAFSGSNSAGTVFTSLGTSMEVGPTAVVESPNFTAIVRTNEGASPDYNDNGVVDAADYTVWRDSLGQTGIGLPADGNLNRVIDSGDYDFWKANFGLMVPGAGGGSASNASRVAGTGASRVVPDPGTSAIPEPATATLLAGAAVLLFLRPKTRVSRNVSFP